MLRVATLIHRSATRWSRPAIPGLRRQDWDEHVSELDEMVLSPGFQALKDEII